MSKVFPAKQINMYALIKSGAYQYSSKQPGSAGISPGLESIPSMRSSRSKNPKRIKSGLSLSSRGKVSNSGDHMSTRRMNTVRLNKLGKRKSVINDVLTQRFS